MTDSGNMKRREFISKLSTATGGLALAPSILFGNKSQNKRIRLALVGTGVRGTSMWGKDLVDNYSDYIEFVGLCDVNPGRLKYAREYIGADCQVFTDFEEMMKKTKPELLVVTTVDSTHHEFIVKGMEMGADIITEKPMTTDEFKCQQILDTERKTGRNVRVIFNYRYTPLTTKIKELLMDNRVGEIVSVDFHWYLDIHHGASYFRRWHGLRDKSGTLLLHKASHHFDVLNWFLDSDPELIYAWGDLNYYGKNNSFRSGKCRGCEHKDKCKFFWDITASKRDMDLYVNNENYDGYIRDGCIWREEIDIYDKMAVQIKYANNVFTSYSLTTYSPYEGWRIAFNGTKGRLDASLGVPWESELENNANAHEGNRLKKITMK